MMNRQVLNYHLARGRGDRLHAITERIQAGTYPDVAHVRHIVSRVLADMDLYDSDDQTRMN